MSESDPFRVEVIVTPDGEAAVRIHFPERGECGNNHLDLTLDAALRHAIKVGTSVAHGADEAAMLRWWHTEHDGKRLADSAIMLRAVREHRLDLMPPE